MFKSNYKWRACRSKKGFTIVEMLFSLSIFLILICVLMVSIFGGLSRRWKSREAASVTLRVLRKAKWLAISENKEYGVKFVHFLPGSPWQAHLMVRSNEGPWIPAESPLALPLEVKQLSLTGSLIKEFNPDGTSSSGSVIICCVDGHTYRISLTPSTGRIRLYREVN